MIASRSSISFESPPMRTVGSPSMIMPPWNVRSYLRAAGSESMSTRGEPIEIEFGMPALHVAGSQKTAPGSPPT